MYEFVRAFTSIATNLTHRDFFRESSTFLFIQRVTQVDHHQEYKHKDMFKMKRFFVNISILYLFFKTWTDFATVTPFRISSYYIIISNNIWETIRSRSIFSLQSCDCICICVKICCLIMFFICFICRIFFYKCVDLVYILIFLSWLTIKIIFFKNSKINCL